MLVIFYTEATNVLLEQLPTNFDPLSDCCSNIILLLIFVHKYIIW